MLGASDSNCRDEAVEVRGELDADNEAMDNEEFDTQLDADDKAAGVVPLRMHVDAGARAWAR